MMPMITRVQIQFIRSLEQKRNRDESGCFIAEGDKLVREALVLPKESRFTIKSIYCLDHWLESNRSAIENSGVEVISIPEHDLGRISLQKTPNQVLAIIERPIANPPADLTADELRIGLDQVQDPGNVGTIIRLADWFGLGAVISSEDSADFYSPKVVQASMGSIFRVRLLTANLPEYIHALPENYPVYGTDLEGEDLYHADITRHGLIIMGNESKGLSQGLAGLMTKNLRIPDFPGRYSKPESLNVSIAAAIVCAEFRRRGRD
ncbi:MAG: RNA methyltransferase [Bacteroidales bacterium]